jgi:parallel beta-helix repeat protein
MNWAPYSGTALFLSTCLLAPTAAFAQGNLTPPGPPGPTMKTLDQIEPRTSIGTLPFKISKSGSYAVTGDLTGTAGKAGITIAADDVTLDLNGFSLIGVAGSLAGIDLEGARRNVVVRNGTVRAWGEKGLALSGAASSQIEQVRSLLNGAAGLHLGESGRAHSCIASDNGGFGIEVGSGTTVSQCVASGNLDGGIKAGSGCAIRDCMVVSNDSHGLQVASACVIEGNLSRLNGQATAGAGLNATGDANRIENNHLLGNGIGLLISGSGNTVANNTVKGNLTNYQITAGNQLQILLCELPATISWPAHVTLAGSLTGAAGAHGIAVLADDVTIDLNGGSLVGTVGAFSGISAAAIRNLTVRNGSVRGWPQHGVLADAAVNGVFEKLHLSNNASVGLAVGEGALVRDCVARGNGRGFQAILGGLVTSCTATGHSLQGFLVSRGTTITGCVANGNRSHGIEVGESCQVVANSCYGNSGLQLPSVAGILVTGSDNSIKGNHLLSNDRGLQVDVARNFIVENTVKNNGINFSITDPINQTLGKIVQVGDNLDTAPPWANFDFGQRQ